MSEQNKPATVPSVDDVVTCGKQPFGTSHWAGTYKGYPAVTLSYFSGADLFYFDTEWKSIHFRSLADCHESLGITRY